MQILNTYILPARGSPPSTAPIAKSRDTLLGCFGFEALVQGYGNRQPKHFLRLSTLGVPIFVQVVFFTDDVFEVGGAFHAWGSPNASFSSWATAL
jgi:hypothetical protein